MERERPRPRSIERLRLASPALWLIAIVFFGIGDLITTSIGLSIDGVYEAGPVTSVFVERYGLPSIVVVKLGLFGGCYALWKLVPSPHRVGVPLGLAVLGVVVVGWNIFVTAAGIYL